MDLGLSGKHALVVGGTRGIGRAIAHSLAAEGCHVGVVARTADDLLRVADELRAAGPGEPRTFCGDATDAAFLQAVVQAYATSGLELAVANVGKSYARHSDEMDDTDFAQSLAMNLWPAQRVARLAMPLLSQRQGALVLIASIWGREAGGAPGYNVAKAGVIALGKALARDVAARGVRVNTVAPGSILFDGGGWARRQAADPAAIAEFVTRELPAGRFGAPHEVADVVTFLLSPRARWINGACVVVDGAQSRMF